MACKQTPGIKLTDLKFADFESEQIAINRIDSTFMIPENWGLNGDLRGSGTSGHFTYDSSGRLLTETKNRYFGHHVEYSYDSIGLLKSKVFFTDFSARFEIKYIFLPDSLKLYQIWSGSADDTCVFKFNKKGWLIQSLQYKNDDSGKGELFLTDYEYLSSGQILRKRVEFMKTAIMEERNKLGIFSPDKNITHFYYSGKLLDSTITFYYYTNKPEINYSSKMYYKNGLKEKEVDRDSFLTNFIHKIKIQTR